VPLELVTAVASDDGVICPGKSSLTVFDGRKFGVIQAKGHAEKLEEAEGSCHILLRHIL